MDINISNLWVFSVIIFIIILIFEEISYEPPQYKSYDNKKELIDHVLGKIRHNHIAEINWRRSLIISLITAFILNYFLFYPSEIPPGFVYFFIVIILFSSIYFATAWTSCHWWRMIDYQIEDSLLEFRHKIKNNTIKL